MITGALAIGILSCLVTWYLSRYLVHKNVIDVPGERNSHVADTPRGGGIAFVLGISAILALAWHHGIIDLAQLLAIALPGLAIATVGFVDDLRSLGLRPRLITQVCAACTAILIVPLPEIPLGSYRLDHLAVLFPLYLLATVWFINLYNFMDGIDGIASIEAVSMLLSAGFILALNQDDEQVSLLLALSTPIIGFLVWNFPRAKIFMGDVGSGYLGFILAMLACLTSSTTNLNIWTWIILGALFIADSTYTLLQRMRSGQAWTQPHRSHAYQMLARRLDSHAGVNLALLGANLLYLLPLAWLSARSPGQGWILAMLAYFPILVGCRLLGAGNLSPGSQKT